MTRSSIIKIDLTRIQNPKELHATLGTSLNFPTWYGQNWDAFWDAITGLVEMPMHLNICGWDTFSSRLPREAALLKKCLANMASEYPESAPAVAFD